MYQALYRKWRPRTFDQVVGQAHITDTLKRQVAEDRLSHAYLFTGTRGTGKTTCAKILARAVNCQAPVDGNPCNACPACLGIENGSILDVLELDAASNNGVDQIRALRDEAVYAPASVRRRVYIVDEVHMLSTPAFNALLKILEEPPAHLMFILATTELHKVPATIKSRCQQFAFKRISPQAISAHLSEVAGQEGMDLAPAAAELLARLADGGLRDGLSLLDQCAGGAGTLTEERVLEVLGLAGSRRTARLLSCVAEGDTSVALEELDSLYRDGKDMGALLGELSALLRDLLIHKTAPAGGRGLLTGGYEESVVRDLAQRFTAAELVQMMTVVQNAQADLYRSASRRVDTELCLIRLCDRRLSSSLDGLAARLSRLEEQLARGMVPADPQPEGPSKAAGQTGQSAASGAEASASPVPTPDLPPWDSEPAPLPGPARNSPPPPPAPSKRAAGQWQAFLETLQGLPAGARSMLRTPGQVRGVFDERTLTLWVENDMTKAILSKPDTAARLEAAAAAFTGGPKRLAFRVGEAPPEDALPAEPADPAGPDPSAPPEKDPLDDLLDLGRQFGNFTVT